MNSIDRMNDLQQVDNLAKTHDNPEIRALARVVLGVVSELPQILGEIQDNQTATFHTLQALAEGFKEIAGDE